MSVNNDQFYATLAARRMSLGDLLIRADLFEQVPQNWHVIITDIKGSTKAVLGGQHQVVNLIATGSIVTVLNIAFAMHVAVPFFFGGDGATFIIPPGIIDKVMQALLQYKANTLTNFDLELRTGTVPVETIYAQGHQLQIAKFSSSANLSIPIVLGQGLNYAEQLIKGDDYLMSKHQPLQEDLDLTGMQCRWDRIPAPENRDEVVTLLVVACNAAQQAQVFRKVMNRLDEIYGAPQKRQPISVAKLKFTTTFNRIETEMRARIGKIKWLELIREWLVNLYAPIFFRTRDGKNYLKNMVEMSDTLVIDGKINTVISGTAGQRADLKKLLDEMENAGEIIYGIHISNASVMSCYVRDLKYDHIHFVDGSEGGYTQAARVLKAKL